MKSNAKIKLAKRKTRAIRIRSEIFGTPETPRLSVFRSLKQIYVQLIDDSNHKTLASASSQELKGKKAKKSDLSFEVGKLIAKKALDKNIKKVVFDKGGFKYHGRVKSLADGAREGGLVF